MKGHGSKFHRKMYQAIAALLKHSTVEEAARAVGIAPNTLSKWMKVPEFMAAFREAIHMDYSQSMSRLRQATPAAVTTVLKNMVDPKAPHAARQRAAEYVIERTAKAIEAEDVVARVEALERLMKENV
jgi:transposase-like protein